MRYPVYIDKEGYTKFDGEPSENKDELADYLEDELLISPFKILQCTLRMLQQYKAQFRIKQTNNINKLK
jgi:hypothetical protein